MLSHVPIASILVIAPDAELRQSLAFVFEANNFQVRTCTTWPPTYQLGQFDVIILDETAVPRSLYADETLRTAHHRLILLAGRVGATPPIPHARLVHKPLLDTLLLDAVFAMISPRAAASK